MKACRTICSPTLTPEGGGKYVCLESSKGDTKTNSATFSVLHLSSPPGCSTKANHNLFWISNPELRRTISQLHLHSGPGLARRLDWRILPFHLRVPSPTPLFFTSTGFTPSWGYLFFQNSHGEGRKIGLGSVFGVLPLDYRPGRGVGETFPLPCHKTPVPDLALYQPLRLTWILKWGE